MTIHGSVGWLRFRFGRWCRASLAVLALIHSVSSLGESVACDVKPLVVGRSNAPMIVELFVTKATDDLVEGTLEVQIFDGDDRVGWWRSGEMVLSERTTRRLVTLPAAARAKWKNPGAIKVSFLRAGEVLGASRRTFDVPPNDRRTMLIGVVETAARGPVDFDALASRSRFEFLFPEFKRSVVKPVKTVIAPLAIDELPVAALDYCAFDLLVMSPRAHAELGGRRQAAIRRWLEAGGALLIVGGRSEISSLRERLSEEWGFEESTTFQASGFEDSPISLFEDSPKSDFALLKVGWGGAAFIGVARDAAVPYDSMAWRRTLGFLWKLNAKTMKRILGDERGEVRWKLSSKPQDHNVNPIPIGDELKTLLLAKHEGSVIPFPLLLTLVIVYVSLICPGEYYLLGKLGRRQLSCVVFPLTSIAFGLLVMGLAEWFMGADDHVRRLVIDDVGTGNRIARRSVCEWIYKGEEGMASRAFENAIFTPMDQRFFMRRGGGTSPSPPLTLTSGNFPGDYQVTRRHRQWRLVLNRVTTFPDERETTIPWGGFDPTNEKGIQLIAKWFGNRKDFHGEVFVFSARREKSSGSWICDSIWRNYPEGQAGVSKTMMCLMGFRNPFHGFFSLASMVAPHGGGNFEDLCAFDIEDRSNVLLVVARLTEDGCVVLRKKYDASVPSEK